MLRPEGANQKNIESSLFGIEFRNARPHYNKIINNFNRNSSKERHHIINGKFLITIEIESIIFKEKVKKC